MKTSRSEVVPPGDENLALFLATHPRMAARAYLLLTSPNQNVYDQMKSEQIANFLDAFDYLMAVGAFTIRSINRSLGLKAEM